MEDTTTIATATRATGANTPRAVAAVAAAGVGVDTGRNRAAIGVARSSLSRTAHAELKRKAVVVVRAHGLDLLS